MKILILDEEFPWPLNTGKRIRSLNLLRRLAPTHHLTYLAYGTRDSNGYQALSDLGLHPLAVKRAPLPKTGSKLYFRLLGNLFSSQPYSVASHFTSAFQRAVQGELATSSYDLVLCEWTPYAQFVRDLSGVPRLVVAHNVEHQIWQRYVENETQLLVRWYLGLQARRMRTFEEDVFSSVEGATAVSATDAATIKSMAPHLDVEVVDNGVDLEFFDDDSEPADTAAPILVFTGSMDWRPNQDCVEYFVNDILPLVQAEWPDVQTVFVGRNPPPKIADLGRLDGVTITGTVNDVRPHIRDAAVYIVPLRIGGGSRLKILEALAMRKPVVSTGIGAEGLDVTDGRELLLADTPQQFARQINLLLSDRRQARKLGEAGRKLVEQRYGWDALATKLEQFMTRLVAAK